MKFKRARLLAAVYQTNNSEKQEKKKLNSGFWHCPYFFILILSRIMRIIAFVYADTPISSFIQLKQIVDISSDVLRTCNSNRTNTFKQFR